MARKISTVYEGQFMDALKKTYVNKFGTDKPFMRVVPTAQKPIPRKTLERPELIVILQEIDVTITDLFEAAGLPFELSEEETAILSALENMSISKQRSVLSTIRSICDAWWVKILDADESESISAVSRFKQYALHKYAASAEKDITSPLLKTMFPCRLINKIPTDIYPQFCFESGVPVSYLMDLPLSKIRFYSKNANADKVFTEYKMLYSEDLRSIIRQIILKC